MTGPKESRAVRLRQKERDLLAIVRERWFRKILTGGRVTLNIARQAREGSFYNALFLRQAGMPDAVMKRPLTPEAVKEFICPTSGASSTS